MADAAQWQIQPPIDVPGWVVETVRSYNLESSGRKVAQLLWQLGLHDPEQLTGFLNVDRYQPASPFEFGAEINWAIERIQQARDRQELVTIWGDFDADGITATSVLWEGLQQFLPGSLLQYVIPNRLTESHGLAIAGIERLAEQHCTLIITCDTGSTNLAEIDRANDLGIDVIITDHHTLPEERPDVVAMLNPRQFAPDHPLAHLSGVAVAYKLIEALYETWPDLPTKPLSSLLDLVAIGLIADLVELKQDCRYLAQMGIQQLQRQSKPDQATRPGVAKLLELCQRNGDRPTDISFGIGPRINAISRIHGDASFGVELLTSGDRDRCQTLAAETELANTRRKALQKDVANDVRSRLAQMDLSTTHVIVLADPQWSVGVLGLVAGQIARESGRPVVLLNTEASFLSASAQESSSPDLESNPTLARGSARSVNQIDLYQLLHHQRDLLHSMGGHPYAAGLSLPIQNIPLFTEAINRQFRAQYGDRPLGTVITANLTVTVAELGRALFRELKLLEPCGIGNPAPKLLVKNCWVKNAWNQNFKDYQGRKISYIKTTFELWDETVNQPVPGIWWEHYKDELPRDRCEMIGELDFNAYTKKYEFRVIDVRPSAAESVSLATQTDWILDWRSLPSATPDSSALDSSALIIDRCPRRWTDLYVSFRLAQREQKSLAIAYPPPNLESPIAIWQRLVGIGKYLSRTERSVTRSQWLDALGIGDRTLYFGIQALQSVGFTIRSTEQGFFVSQNTDPDLSSNQDSGAIAQFLSAIREDQFQQDYFSRVSLTTIRTVAAQVLQSAPA